VFDELEKAHPDVLNMLLQILEEGKLTDSQGRVVDFRNTIILLTSNAGAELIKKQGVMGFGAVNEEATYDKMREKLLDESKRVFKPEFLNRLDDIIVFHSLSKPDLIRILDLEIAKVDERLKQRGLAVVLDDLAKEFLVGKVYDPTYGARPMRRAVERYLEDPLAEERLKGTIHDGEVVNVTVEGDKLVFKQAAAASGALPVS
jgi:ATP-dependent Clp protease ATP-binding subunit ClpC